MWCDIQEARCQQSCLLPTLTCSRLFHRSHRNLTHCVPCARISRTCGRSRRWSSSSASSCGCLNLTLKRLSRCNLLRWLICETRVYFFLFRFDFDYDMFPALLSLSWRLILHLNFSIATLRPQSNGPSCSNTVTGTLAVDTWAVTCSTARRGLGRAVGKERLGYWMGEFITLRTVSFSGT